MFQRVLDWAKPHMGILQHSREFQSSADSILFKLMGIGDNCTHFILAQLLTLYCENTLYNGSDSSNAASYFLFHVIKLPDAVSVLNLVKMVHSTLSLHDMAERLAIHTGVCALWESWLQRGSHPTFHTLMCEAYRTTPRQYNMIIKYLFEPLRSESKHKQSMSPTSLSALSFAPVDLSDTVGLRFDGGQTIWCVLTRREYVRDILQTVHPDTCKSWLKMKVYMHDGHGMMIRTARTILHFITDENVFELVLGITGTAVIDGDLFTFLLSGGESTKWRLLMLVIYVLETHTAFNTDGAQSQSQSQHESSDVNSWMRSVGTVMMNTAKAVQPAGECCMCKMNKSKQPTSRNRGIILLHWFDDDENDEGTQIQPRHAACRSCVSTLHRDQCPVPYCFNAIDFEDERVRYEHIRRCSSKREQKKQERERKEQLYKREMSEVMQLYPYDDSDVELMSLYLHRVKEINRKYNKIYE